MISVSLQNALKASLSVPCPRCGAAPGEKCKASSGKPIQYSVHRQRFAVAVKLRRGGLGVG